MSAKPFPDPRIEAISQGASRVFEADGPAMATQYIYGALEQEGLYDMAHPSRSKIKGWEVHAIATRSLFLYNQRKSGEIAP